MQPTKDNRYALQDLHDEIDLFDRKIAHCEHYETFESEQARTAALGKLRAKREALVKAALAMASRGVECDPKHLPRSFRQAAQAAAKVAS